VNADDCWQAAALLAVDPQGLGGALLRGRPGAARDDWVAALRAALPSGAPVARVPMHIDDERLLGGLDLGATLHAGRPIAQRGLLAQVDGGVLLVPMAERLPPARAAQLASVLDRRELALERDGLTARLPARIAVVAFDESLADDEAVPAALAERLGLHLALEDGPRGAAPPAVADLATRAAQARARLATMRCGDDLLQALVEAAQALGVASLRAPWFALCAARAAAALSGRDTVTADDAGLAARLVLAPRATRAPSSADDATAPESAVPPDDATPPPPEPPPGDADDEAARGEEQPAVQAKDLAERVLQAALAALPPGLLAQLAGAPGGVKGAAAGRAGAWQASRLRGRPYGSRRGEPRAGARLHLVETLRAAAPWQALRRRERGDAIGAAPRVLVTRDDFHVARYRQRRETTTVFVVDASGSAALHRLAEAKGAVELLLADCYVRRDRVALVSFRGSPVGEGTGAEVLLPPTRSLVRAKRSLSALPGGGGTPLAAGLECARRLVAEEARRGATPVVVVLSDGRANIARDGSPGRTQAAEDALAAARLWPALGVGTLWLDTAPQPQATARLLAQAMGARYLPLPHADARQLSQAVRAASG
jgi:magnesium chelatase subunit D